MLESFKSLGFLLNLRISRYRISLARAMLNYLLDLKALHILMVLSQVLEMRLIPPSRIYTQFLQNYGKISNGMILWDTHATRKVQRPKLV